jgi:HEPN domain-containing protein
MSVDEALGRYAEAVQDLSSAGLALAAGTYFNCADLCNQAVEKMLQAVYVLRHTGPAAYDHDLRALGTAVGAPEPVLADLDALNPYHPEAYLAHRAPDDADDAVGPETADELLQAARRVMRWVRPLILASP